MLRRLASLPCRIVLLALTLTAGLHPSATARGYTQEEIDYFLAVALAPEYGNPTRQIRRWSGELRIRLFGRPTAQDRITLARVIAELNVLIPNVRLQLVRNEPNVELLFVPRRRFPEIEPNYRGRNLGFFWTRWNRAGEIYHARILVSTDVGPRQRAHILREELTQALGLMSDSAKYPDSIFYDGPSDVSEFAPIDRVLISMLYREEIRPSMKPRLARRILAALER